MIDEYSSRTKYDAVLCVVPDTNNDYSFVVEVDDRAFGANKTTVGAEIGPPAYRIDPKYWGSNSFGATVQQALNNMGREWSCKVSDFKKYVVVEVTYHNMITCKSASKTYLIVFDEGQNGIVMSHMSKWRTISGCSQAISYIQSASQSLKNDAK